MLLQVLHPLLHLKFREYSLFLSQSVTSEHHFYPKKNKNKKIYIKEKYVYGNIFIGTLVTLVTVGLNFLNNYQFNDYF